MFSKGFESVMLLVSITHSHEIRYLEPTRIPVPCIGMSVLDMFDVVGLVGLVPGDFSAVALVFDLPGVVTTFRLEKTHLRACCSGTTVARENSLRSV
jgi:hypothetical protein